MSAPLGASQNTAQGAWMTNLGADRDERLVSSWLLRLVLAGAVIGAWVITLVTGSGTGALTVLGVLLLVLGALTVFLPGSPATTFLLLGVVTCHLMFGTASIDLGLGLLAAFLLLIHQLAGICAAIPLSSKVVAAALRPALLRFVSCVLIVELSIAAIAVLS